MLHKKKACTGVRDDSGRSGKQGGKTQIGTPKVVQFPELKEVKPRVKEQGKKCIGGLSTQTTLTRTQGEKGKKTTARRGRNDAGPPDLLTSSAANRKTSNKKN